MAEEKNRYELLLIQHEQVKKTLNNVRELVFSVDEETDPVPTLIEEWKRLKRILKRGD